ncbi:MAG: glutathione S-transferase [Proteobacteria bacterium]|nr:glutathione S-transferase [Pseudomonadota bacterium]
MLRVWGRANSVNVKKVLWCVGELGLPFERIDAGMEYGVVGTPGYQAMNPNARVPTIDDDGFVLWESNTIVRYLALKYGLGSLCPVDIRERADSDRWMDWTTAQLAPTFREVFWGTVRTPPEKRDLAIIEKNRAATAKTLDIVERLFGTRPFVAGDQLTMGDIPLGCYVHLWMSMPIERPAHPNLVAWHKRLLERPAFNAGVNTPLS